MHIYKTKVTKVKVITKVFVSYDYFIITTYNGISGAPGLRGPMGRDGIPGIEGMKGDKGSSGLPGLPGPLGPAGLRGDSGFDGRPGVSVREFNFKLLHSKISHQNQFHIINCIMAKCDCLIIYFPV